MPRTRQEKILSCLEAKQRNIQGESVVTTVNKIKSLKMKRKRTVKDNDQALSYSPKVQNKAKKPKQTVTKVKQAKRGKTAETPTTNDHDDDQSEVEFQEQETMEHELQDNEVEFTKGGQLIQMRVDAEEDQFNSEDQDMTVGEEDLDCSSSADEESDLDQSNGGPDPISEEVDQEADQPCTSQVTQYQNKLRELDTEIKERMLELRSMMQSKGLNESAEILEESFSGLCNQDKRKSKGSKGENRI